MANPILNSIYANICLAIETPGPPFPQIWTAQDDGIRGYPIVDGKYFDGKTGQVVTMDPSNPWATGGPPSLDIFWHNRRRTTVKKPFCGAVKSSGLSMTEYVIQVGEFLKECKCELQSLTATTYSVNVVVFADMSNDDMHLLWQKYGL